jgi:hypothetical protein
MADETRLERWARYKADPDKTMTTICDHVANGGSVLDLARVWELPYNLIIDWVQTDELRNKRYVQALEARGEWAKERVLSELRAIALIDIRELFDDEGNLLPVSEWPEQTARAVAGVDTMISNDGDVTKKIKLIDKTKSLEMLMKNLAMLVERVDHTGKITLSDILAESNKPGEKK